MPADNPLVIKHEANVLEMQGQGDHTCRIHKKPGGGIEILATESWDGMTCDLDESLRLIIADFLSRKEMDS